MSKTVTTRDIHGTEYQVPISDISWRPSVYAIVVHDGKILLTKQHGAYHLPGGRVELGESLEQALFREVQEETGITVEKPRLVECISGYFTTTESNHHQTILLFYQCSYGGGELSMDGMEEGEKTHGEMPEWILLDQLDGIKAGSTVDWRKLVEPLRAY